MADVILPGAAYTEKDGTYANTEGRSQTTRRAVTPPGMAREDWKIVRALSEFADAPLPYDTLGEVRSRLFKAAPHLEHYESIVSTGETLPAPTVPTTAVLKEPLRPPMRALRDYYRTDPISRASKVMAECVESVDEMPGEEC